MTNQIDRMNMIDQVIDTYKGLQFKYTILYELYLEAMCVKNISPAWIRYQTQKRIDRYDAYAKSLLKVDELPQSPIYNTLDELIEQSIRDGKVAVNDTKQE